MQPYVQPYIQPYIRLYIKPYIHTASHTYKQTSILTAMHTAIHTLSYSHTFSHTYSHTDSHTYSHTYSQPYIHTNIYTADRLEWITRLRSLHSLYRQKEASYWEKLVSSNSYNPKRLWSAVSGLLGGSNHSMAQQSFTADEFLRSFQ